MSSIFQNFLLGHQAGRQNLAHRQEQSKLAQLQALAPQVIAGDPSAFTQAAALDPAKATQYQQAGDGQLRRLQNYIRHMDAARATGKPEAVQAALRAGAPLIKQLTGRDVPPDATWTPDWDAGWEELKAKVAMVPAQAGDAAPAGYRQFEMMASAAGLKPGTPEYQQAAKIALGAEGRASSAGYSQVKFTGADGRERIGVLNGKTGQIDLPDGTSFNPQTGQISATQADDGLGAPGGVPLAQPALDFANDAQQFAALGIPVSSTVRTPERNGEVGGVPNSYHLTGEAMDVVPRNAQEKAQATQYWRSRGYQVIDEGDHLHIEPPARGATTSRLSAGGSGAFVGRTKEEEAAATEAAKLGVQLEYLPTELAMRSEAAVNQAIGIERGKTAVEQAAAAPAAIETMQSSIKVIDELLDDPDLGTIVGMGSVNPLNYLPGSKARGLIARAEQISGKAFLAAFNQLKGAGAITEKEGEAATRAMARLDRSQSLEDYRTALADLRAAIAPGLARQRQVLARGQAGQAQPQSAGAPRVQTPDDYARLPSGATYIAPDGSVRRKK